MRGAACGGCCCFILNIIIIMGWFVRIYIWFIKLTTWYDFRFMYITFTFLIFFFFLEVAQNYSDVKVLESTCDRPVHITFVIKT